jgi:hypothetical protein
VITVTILIDGDPKEIAAFLLEMGRQRLGGPCKVEVPLEIDGKRVIRDFANDPWFLHLKEEFEAEQE